MGTLLIHWTPFLVIALIVTAVLLRAGLVHAGRWTTEPISEGSRRTYAGLVFIFFLVAAALGQSMLPIPLGIAMTMLVYHRGVHYRRTHG